MIGSDAVFAADAEIGSDAVFADDAEIGSDAVFAADFSMNSDAELGGMGKTDLDKPNKDKDTPKPTPKQPISLDG